MSNYPNTGKVQTLEPPIDTPKRPTKGFGTNGTKSLDGLFRLADGINVGGQVPKDGANDEVSCAEAQTSGGITNIVLGRDGGANLA